MGFNGSDRRPVKTRNKTWAKKCAHWLQSKNITPNQISVASTICALIAGLSFLFSFYFSSWIIREVLLLSAVFFIQLRLACNLLDGMVAVEGGLATPSGPVYNELPDRLSDTLIFIGVGYGLGAFPFSGTMSLLAALAALMTAYLRLLGGSCGLRQHFSGPMAKQHRMALLSMCTLVALALPSFYGQQILFMSLIGITIGSLFTCWRRVRIILNELNQNSVKQESNLE